MKCQDVCKYLSEYMDDELDVKIKKDVSAHLLACSSCRAQLEQMKRIKAVFLELPEVSPPSELKDEIMSRIRDIQEHDCKSGISRIAAKVANAVRTPWCKAVTVAAMFVMTIGIATLWGGGIENINIIDDTIKRSEILKEDTHTIENAYDEKGSAFSNQNDVSSGKQQANDKDINSNMDVKDEGLRVEKKLGNADTVQVKSSKTSSVSNDSVKATNNENSSTSNQLHNPGLGAEAQASDNQATVGDTPNSQAADSAAVASKTDSELQGLPEYHNGVVSSYSVETNLLISSVRIEITTDDIEGDIQRVMDIVAQYGDLLTVTEGTIQFVVDKKSYSIVLSKISLISEEVDFKQTHKDVTQEYNCLVNQLNEKEQQRAEALKSKDQLGEDLKKIEAEINELKTIISNYQKRSEEVEVIVEFISLQK
ncbi:zf-HC2 domain-containing protein [Peptococcaceae bacterium]|nr:zf-HC2 domain-containing protein [Peptococcaceae bacterium]